MIRRLYDWTMSLAGHPHAMWALFLIAFIESSFFPIPPDALIIPMVLAARHRWLRIALVATAGSVLGALFGYWIGAMFMDTLGQPILAAYGKEGDFADLSARFDEWGGWAVLVAGLTPFPFKVVTIFSGAVQLNLAVFIVTAIIARATRFLIVAWLLKRYGAPIREFIERRLGLVFTLFMIALIGGFYILRYL
ncbi:MAG: YqaA family protein [Paracoccus sp. (in: a-proteobacteria)]|nr:YqaA family protein [Paracoccus sp. (in: a-proteobacteria)]